ncbi:MAG: methyltransferase domain-containing protein [Gammaproteobacteria bacterium]|nr:methyltransferase domain-containing protein [Gammaproteobacteria bacterium]MBI5614949.1 methyltransferase domain-containing protein [Gammaproteobacteria bacterium]
MQELAIDDREFKQFRDLLYQTAGIALADHKKALVAGRLRKRLEHYGLSSYKQYFDLITTNPPDGERQVAIDLLTTNETYFYREPKHFEFLANTILPARERGVPYRIWSAASSSGEEPYTLAMVCAEAMGVSGNWEIVASDISTRVLAKAQEALYPMERAQHIPQAQLSSYCLRGVGAASGMFKIDKPLRDKIKFMIVNLNQALPDLGRFDVIFLRNVLFYFDRETKCAVVDRVARALKPHGYLFISHSESLQGISEAFTAVRPAAYRKN